MRGSYGRGSPHSGVRVSERRLPIYVRWTLAAEGVVHSPTLARPVCPVAAWWLEVRPELWPTDPDPERLTAVRVRADVVDTMMLQIRDVAHADRRELSVWCVGAGLDARWARLGLPMAPIVSRWVEVEDPAVLRMKHRLLVESPFRRHWAQIEAMPVAAIGWDVQPEPEEWPVVLLMGLLHRVSAAGLRTLLRRIRETAPRASVLLDLTGVHGRARSGWSARRLAQLAGRSSTMSSWPSGMACSSRTARRWPRAWYRCGSCTCAPCSGGLPPTSSP